MSESADPQNYTPHSKSWFKPALKIFGAGILFIVFLFFVQEISRTIRYKPYEKALSEAQREREEGDLETGEKILLELEQQNPDEPAAYIELSYLYEDMGILDSALKQAELAREKTLKALSQGNLFLNRVRLWDWKETLKQRIEDLPLAIEGQEAIRIWSTGDREGAILKLRSLEKKYPSAYQPQAALSVLYKNTGDVENAIKEADAAIQKIDAKLALKKLNRKIRNLIEQDRENLQSLIDELQIFYAED